MPVNNFSSISLQYTKFYKKSIHKTVEIRYINMNIYLLAGDVQKNNIMNTQEVYPKVEKSFVNGTNDREACPKRWIAVLVQMNCEKKTSTLLNKAGYETYIPTQQEIHQWSDRKKKSIVLLCQ